MKSGLRLAIAAYIGFFMYSLLIFIFGESGVVELGRLESHRAKLVENIAQLEAIGMSLEQNRDGLLHDSEEIALLSRRLGYFSEDEVLIKIEGDEHTYASRTLGKMIRSFHGEASNTVLFRAIALITALCATVVVFLLSGRRHGRTA